MDSPVGHQPSLAPHTLHQEGPRAACAEVVALCYGDIHLADTCEAGTRITVWSLPTCPKPQIIAVVLPHTEQNLPALVFSENWSPRHLTVLSWVLSARYI